MKLPLTAVCLTLLLAACTSPIEVPPSEPVPGNSNPMPTPVPVPVPTPVPIDATGFWELNLNKSYAPNERFWVSLSQEGTVLKGRAYEGYVSSEGHWIEPYSNPASGSVEGTEVSLTLLIFNDYSDVFDDEEYRFKGTITNKVFSGTWTRHQAVYAKLQTGSGSFQGTLSR